MMQSKRSTTRSGDGRSNVDPRPLPRGLRAALRDWRLGREYGFPICCIVHFCLDRLFGRAAAMTRWRQIAAPASWPATAFVPCGILHPPASRQVRTRLILRILCFQVAWALPGPRGRRLRRLAKHGGRAWWEADTAVVVAAGQAGKQGLLWWSDAVPDATA